MIHFVALPWNICDPQMSCLTGYWPYTSNPKGEKPGLNPVPALAALENHWEHLWKLWLSKPHRKNWSDSAFKAPWVVLMCSLCWGPLLEPMSAPVITLRDEGRRAMGLLTRYHTTAVNDHKTLSQDATPHVWGGAGQKQHLKAVLYNVSV